VVDTVRVCDGALPLCACIAPWCTTARLLAVSRRGDIRALSMCGRYELSVAASSALSSGLDEVARTERTEDEKRSPLSGGEKKKCVAG